MAIDTELTRLIELSKALKKAKKISELMKKDDTEKNRKD